MRYVHPRAQDLMNICKVSIIKKDSFGGLVVSQLFTLTIPDIYNSEDAKNKPFQLSKADTNLSENVHFVCFFLKSTLYHSEKMLSFQKVGWMTPHHNLYEGMHCKHVEAGFHNNSYFFNLLSQ